MAETQQPGTDMTHVTETTKTTNDDVGTGEGESLQTATHVVKSEPTSSGSNGPCVDDNLGGSSSSSTGSETQKQTPSNKKSHHKVKNGDGNTTFVQDGARQARDVLLERCTLAMARLQPLGEKYVAKLLGLASLSIQYQQPILESWQVKIVKNKTDRQPSAPIFYSPTGETFYTIKQAAKALQLKFKSTGRPVALYSYGNGGGGGVTSDYLANMIASNNMQSAHGFGFHPMHPGNMHFGGAAQQQYLNRAYPGYHVGMSMLQAPDGMAGFQSMPNFFDLMRFGSLFPSQQSYASMALGSSQAQGFGHQQHQQQQQPQPDMSHGGGQSSLSPLRQPFVPTSTGGNGSNEDLHNLASGIPPNIVTGGERLSSKIIDVVQQSVASEAKRFKVGGGEE